MRESHGGRELFSASFAFPQGQCLLTDDRPPAQASPLWAACRRLMARLVEWPGRSVPVPVSASHDDDPRPWGRRRNFRCAARCMLLDNRQWQPSQPSPVQHVPTTGLTGLTDLAERLHKHL
jgi:hypothetical protein